MADRRTTINVFLPTLPLPVCVCVCARARVGEVEGMGGDRCMLWWGGSVEGSVEGSGALSPTYPSPPFPFLPLYEREREPPIPPALVSL